MKSEDPTIPGMRLIYGRVKRMTCVKTYGKMKGQSFFHDFKEGDQALGLEAGTVLLCPDGTRVKLPKKTILIRHENDKHDLWGMYEY